MARDVPGLVPERETLVSDLSKCVLRASAGLVGAAIPNSCLLNGSSFEIDLALRFLVLAWQSMPCDTQYEHALLCPPVSHRIFLL